MIGSDNNYQAQINPNLLKSSMDKYRGIVEYYLIAEDNMGNSVQSSTLSIAINECLI